MQKKFEQNCKQRCIVGLIACLELCLDAHARAGEFTIEQRKLWSWIEQAVETPIVQTACENLDSDTNDYLTALLCDYQAAVCFTPEDEEAEKEAARLQKEAEKQQAKLQREIANTPLFA